jgi:dTDP-4-amino-4,6-dideoxygalactose transaminase
MSSPDITQAEIDSVLSVLHTPALSMGPQIELLESEVARIAGTKFAIGVSSGTAGLHLAVLISGLDEGDLAVTSPFSFVASANCLMYQKAIPVFVDVEEQTGLINTTLVEEAVEALGRGGLEAARFLPPALQSKKRAVKPAKAIIPVDVFSQPADYDPIHVIAHRHDMTIIEDSCEVIGSGYKGRAAGSLGDVGVFAFYPNKQMTTGEGGVITTNNESWAEMARSLRNQGRTPGETWLKHRRLGYNYRLDEMSAALGLAQTRRLPELLAKRATVAGWYAERLGKMDHIRLPCISNHTTNVSWFVYVIRILPPLEREDVIGKLSEQGIPARKYFSPIHLQPFYVERFGYRKGDFPVTERLGEQSLALPFSSIMTEEQVDRVCDSLRKAVSR